MKIINIALSTLIVSCFVICACDKQNVTDADASTTDATVQTVDTPQSVLDAGTQDVAVSD